MPVSEQQFVNSLPVPGSETAPSAAQEESFVNALPLPPEPQSDNGPATVLRGPMKGYQFQGRTTPPLVERLGLEGLQGIADVGQSLGQLSADVFQHIPGMPSAQSYRDWVANEQGTYGDVVQGAPEAPYVRGGAQAATLLGMLPGMGASGEVIGSEYAPEVWGTVKEGATNLLDKGGLLSRVLVRSLQGGGIGAVSGALTNSSTGNSLSTDIERNAEGGAVMGPLAGPLAKAGGWLLKPFAKGAQALWSRAEPIAAAAMQRLASVVPGGETSLSRAFSDNFLEPGELSAKVKIDMFDEAQQQLSTQGYVNPDSLARKANMEHWGFQPGQAQVIRDKELWSKESDFSRSIPGGPLKDREEANNLNAAQQIQKLSDSMGGIAKDDTEAADSLIQAVTDRYSAQRDVGSSMYQAIRKEVGGDAGLVPKDLMDALGAMKNNMFLKKLTKSVYGQLSDLGAIAKNKEGQWVTTDKPLTVDQSENLRQWIGEELHDGTPRMRLAGARLQHAIDGDVLDTTGSDAFGQARARWRETEQQFRDGGILEQIIDGKVNPDTLISRLAIGSGSRAASVQSWQNLAKAITGTGDADLDREGEQALADVAGRIGAFIQKQSRAFAPVGEGGITESSAGKAANEVGTFRWGSFNGALNRVGPRKMALFFGNSGARNWYSFDKAAYDMFVPPAGTETARTGADFLRMLQGRPLHLKATWGLPGAVLDAAHEVATYAGKRATVNRLMRPTGVAETRAISRNPLVNSVARSALPVWFTTTPSNAGNSP